MALIDLAGKYYDAPAHALLGGQYRDALPISWVAYIRSADELAEEIQEKVAEGFTAFKLKVGADFELDCERVRVCRRIVGPDAYLKADASGAWEEEEAIERIRELAALGVDAVETPIQCVARKVAKDHPEQVNADPDCRRLGLGESARGRARSPHRTRRRLCRLVCPRPLAPPGRGCLQRRARPGRQPAPRPAAEPTRRGRWRTRLARQHGRARRWHGRGRAFWRVH